MQIGTENQFILGYSVPPPLTEIVLLNPYTEKDAPRDKQSILDIRGKTTEGELINVGMQLFNKYDTEKRTLFYWSKLYSGQLQEGQSCKMLKKCVAINILNYSFQSNQQYRNAFHLREERSGISLVDNIELQLLELPKLDDHAIPVESGGPVNWLLFLKGADKSNWEVLTMNEPVLKKAMDTLEFLSQDAEARRLYEDRQKFLHDEASMIEGALAEGEARGERKKALEMAKELLAHGVEISIIAKASGLPESEILALKGRN
uniref:Rpn family recombination-promoting nuclease/putative transposase n=1 Tax=Paenibacillus ehimensis TaxID=79264 RepID=UPI00398ABC0E